MWHDTSSKRICQYLPLKREIAMKAIKNEKDEKKYETNLKARVDFFIC